MYVRAVFDLNGFMHTLDQTPELPFDILLPDWTPPVENGVVRHSRFEIIVLKIIGLLLELAQRIDATVLEPEFAGSDKAAVAVPVSLRNRLHRWIQTVSVVAVVATITQQERSGVVPLA